MKTVTIKLNVEVDPSKASADTDIEQTIKDNLKRLCCSDGGVFKGVDRAACAFKVVSLDPEEF